MTDKYDWQPAFIDQLRKAADPADPDRATLAELRRCLGRDLGRALYRAGTLFARVPDYALDDALLVAALFAAHQGTRTGQSLGAAFRELCQRGGSGSAEKRFVALLDSKREDLPDRLRQAVSLLKSKDVGLDWHRLLSDLARWNHPARWVQRTWARDFWQDQAGRPSTSEASITPATTPA